MSEESARTEIAGAAQRPAATHRALLVWAPAWVTLALFAAAVLFAPYQPIWPSLVLTITETTQHFKMRHIDLAGAEKTEDKSAAGFHDLALGYTTPLNAVANNSAVMQFWLKHLSTSRGIARCFIFDREQQQWGSYYDGYVRVKAGALRPEPSEEIASKPSDYENFAMCRVVWRDISNAVINELMAREVTFVEFCVAASALFCAVVILYFVFLRKPCALAQSKMTEWIVRITVILAIAAPLYLTWLAHVGATPAALTMLGPISFFNLQQSAAQLWAVTLASIPCLAVSIVFGFRRQRISSVAPSPRVAELGIG